MRFKYKTFHIKKLYIFFIILSLNIFFFSTIKLNAKAFEVKNIEISEPFEINFDKNEIIDAGFKNAFNELISLITDSNDQKKIKDIKLNEIKSMIETFSIKEEKFINETYFVNLGVLFNKKKIFNFLENRNIFPSIPNRKKFLFIPIIIDEDKKDLLIFSDNLIFSEWNNYNQSYDLLEYILPTEDLEDLSILKEKYEIIEEYDFKDITNKYFLNDSIILLVFKNKNEIRTLSRITINDEVSLKNQSFFNKDLNKLNETIQIINNLKTNYEDYWKKSNRINTSIKLSLNVQIDTKDDFKVSEFEKKLNQIDLIYDFFITKFNNDNVFYEIIFNGTPNTFLKTMGENDLFFNTQNKIWILK